MENKNIFVIILLFILGIFYMNIIKEKFNSQNTGLYNHFYDSYMNPYSQPLQSFFTNDKMQTLQ